MRIAMRPIAERKCCSVIRFMLVWRVEKSRVLPTRSDMGSMMEPPWRIRKRKSIGLSGLVLGSGGRGGGGREGDAGGGGREGGSIVISLAVTY